jgi:lipoprotein-anchoring transpeptidase ErfK/SrfK
MGQTKKMGYTRLVLLPVIALLVASCSTGTEIVATKQSLPTQESETTLPVPVPTPQPKYYPKPIIQQPPYEKMRVKVESISPRSGTYGVAMPITIKFKKDVPKEYRGHVEELISVDSSKYVPKAAWSWTSGNTLVLRSKDFWPAKTDLKVSANLKGQRVFDSQKRRIVNLAGNVESNISISRELISQVDAKTKKIVVYQNGKKIKEMPTSLGKPGWETRSGIKVVHESYKVKRMTSQAIGAEEFYELDSPYSVRLTPTGEFIHGAPWAAGRMGRANGSHGCTNLNVSDAKWFYNKSMMGDPVITKNTGRKMESWNGLGGPWNVKWKDWLKNSATGNQSFGTPPVEEVSLLGTDVFTMNPQSQETS